MQIKELDLLWKPKEIKTTLNQRDRSKYYRYHRDHCHNTNDCFDLEEEIKSLIQGAYLKDFVKKESKKSKKNF